MPQYVRVASLAAMPLNTGLVAEVNGQEIALFRVGDTVYALENECPHRQGPIAEGDLEDGVVTCPWHAWQIDVSTGAVVYNQRLCSRTYPCRLVGDDVYVDIADAGPKADPRPCDGGEIP